MVDNKVFLKQLSILTNDCSYTIDSHNRALYLLLAKYESKLQSIDDGEYFHKSFRQTDVTGDTTIDLVIWNLLHSCDIFWTLYDRMKNSI